MPSLKSKLLCRTSASSAGCPPLVSLQLPDRYLVTIRPIAHPEGVIAVRGLPKKGQLTP